MPTDNVEITPGTGALVRSEDIGSLIQVQVVKPAYGAPNAATDVDTLTPMPVRMGIPKTQLTTPVDVNATASGDNLVLAGTAAMTIRLMKSTIKNMGDTTVNFKWRSGSVDLHPAMRLKPNESQTLDMDGEPWYTTATAAALNLNLSGAGSVVGTAWVTKSA